MAEQYPGADDATIGRERDIADLRAFVRGETAERAVVISGPPGVGKTTLWRAAVAAAHGEHLPVLASAPGEADANVPFTVLGDLLAGVDESATADLPPPQRRALDVALLRADAGDQPLEPRAIALGLLHVLRTLADRGPILIAIDDIQWADRGSADAIAFATRRAPTNVRVLLARRPSSGSIIDGALERAGIRKIVLGGLSPGAVRRLLAVHLNLSPSRRVLRQIYDTTLGNPLFVLEIGRGLQATGEPAIGEPLFLPESLEDALGTRISALTKGRRALLAVAIGGALPLRLVADLVPDLELQAAIDAGLLVEETGRLRPGHPLFGAAVVQSARPADVRALHRALAEVDPDPIGRARHLAAAMTEPDLALAADLDVAARTAHGRGAIHDAIELAEHALRLTPMGDTQRDERVLTLGDLLSWADEMSRLRDLLSGELEQLLPGNARARGYLLAKEVVIDQAEYELMLEQAYLQSNDPGIRSQVLASQSLDIGVAWLERLPEAEAKAKLAVALAGDGATRNEAAHSLAWAKILRGEGIESIRAEAFGAAWVDPAFTLERLAGVREAFRGNIERARRLFVEELGRLDAAGYFEATSIMTLQLAELALRSGDLAEAGRWIDEVQLESTEHRISVRSVAPRLRATEAAIRGDIAAVERWSVVTLEVILGQRWDEIEIFRARGIAALATGDGLRAVAQLLEVWSRTEREGLDPGAFPSAPDLVEAALIVGDSALATSVTAGLTVMAQAQEHPWALASVERCQGLLLAFAGDLDGAAASLRSASRKYAQLGCRFDAARSLLALGRGARRARKWAIARGALGDAALGFDALGCDGWASQARRQLEGLGGRRPQAAGSLTPTERRAAELARDGRSNKEIAAALFVGVHTVEVHLGRAYAKLGVQSRAQLSGALGASGMESDPSIN